jgi:hypothetical protein
MRATHSGLAAISGGLSPITNAVIAWNAVRMDAIAAANPDRDPAHHWRTSPQLRIATST